MTSSALAKWDSDRGLVGFGPRCDDVMMLTLM
jgi:hypothetical protein